MPAEKTDRSKAIFAIVLLIGIAAAAAFWGLRSCKKSEKRSLSQSPAPTPGVVVEQKTPIAVEKETVIDVAELEKGSETKKEMDQRKTDLGVGEGLDLIVKPGESIKIGDSIVPVEEILERIRLKTGDLSETDLAAATPDTTKPLNRDQSIKELETAEIHKAALLKQLATARENNDLQLAQKLEQALEKLEAYMDSHRRFLALQDQIEKAQETQSDQATQTQSAIAKVQSQAQTGSADTEPLDELKLQQQIVLHELKYRRQEKELRALLDDAQLTSNTEMVLKYQTQINNIQAILATHNQYKRIVAQIAELQQKLQGASGQTATDLNSQIKALDAQRQMLERQIRQLFQQDKALNAYGIYVVRRFDNIWNIHFKFLRDYYNNKGIALSPLSDEPDEKGRSSGVGKLLKFSENMVYIYNVRERKLDVDLNMIEPLSKIVVFNLGQVFSLLDTIDYSDIHRIQFDGENLWVPAAQ